LVGNGESCRYAEFLKVSPKWTEEEINSFRKHQILFQITPDAHLNEAEANDAYGRETLTAIGETNCGRQRRDEYPRLPSVTEDVVLAEKEVGNW